MAMSNRLHLYAKCFLSQDLSVEVVVPSSERSSVERFYDGIKYSTFLNPIIFKNYILRQINSFFASFIYTQYCFNIAKKYDIIFMVGFGWFSTPLMIIGSHWVGTKVVLEVNENPYSQEGGRLDLIFIRKIRRKLMLNFSYKLADGFIVISESLKKLVNKHKNKHAQIIKIPILVYGADESIKNPEKKYTPYIFHAGALSETKDGVIAVFEAYAKACKQLTVPLRFILTNKLMQPNLSRKIDAIIKATSLEDRVIFTGYLSKKEIDQLRSSCSLAIVNKPSNWQNDFNFPTKLGEYLLSGIPVIVSSTGEMNKFLKDNETAFVVPANNADAMAEKILFIINNPDFAVKVGKAGKSLALKEFYYLNYAQEIVDFFWIVAN